MNENEKLVADTTEKAKEFAFSKVGKQFVDEDAKWILQFAAFADQQAAQAVADEKARILKGIEAVKEASPFRRNHVKVLDEIAALVRNEK